DREVCSARTGGGQEEDGDDEKQERPRAERTVGEQYDQRHGDQRGAEIGPRDHRYPAERVEQSAEHHRPQEVTQRPNNVEHRSETRGNIVERGEQQREVERHTVVDESLADEQCDSQYGTFRVDLERRAGDRPERDHITLPNSDAGFGRGQFTPGLGDHLALDTVHDLFGLFLTPVDEHPPRTLGYVPTYQHDREAEYRADRERDAPPPEH